MRTGHFGQTPESIHEKAFQLLRLIVVNHPFVDGNKRTALRSTRIFYSLNGLEFDYDRKIKEILKALATDETSVNSDAVLSYLREKTHSLEPEYDSTVQLWLSQITLNENQPGEGTPDGSSEPNGYD
ncbi:type II toxin-antitoxin system death-on-curing family toxin [Halopiger djelfimassiliensis]|uniref:type II toxin-antitoxin system death-on-curing family toxin n=1 Tax=Halopiger djelfimassiliensis TaxID=1293047 RepID=UPI002DD985C0|nr:type II toxin-antitoxin system death-on-curing family toxin [Halopiger djelfimassiliensis]